jgi:hypothetical protein
MTDDQSHQPEHIVIDVFFILVIATWALLT